MPYFVLDPSTAAAAPAAASLSPGPGIAADHPVGKSLLALRTRLKLELGNRTDLTDPVLNELINDAYFDFASALDLPELRGAYTQSLVVGQPFYLLPAAVDAVLGIAAADPTDGTIGAPLEKADWQTFRKLPDVSGEPDVWFRAQNMIVIWRTPDDTYTVAFDVRIKPAKLAADTDYPIFEDKWHEALYKAAKGRAWEAVQNDTKAALAENAVNRLVQRRTDREAEEQDTEYPSFRPIRSRADLMALRRNARRIEPGE